MPHRQEKMSNSKLPEINYLITLKCFLKRRRIANEEPKRIHFAAIRKHVVAIMGRVYRYRHTKQENMEIIIVNVCIQKREEMESLCGYKYILFYFILC